MNLCDEAGGLGQGCDLTNGHGGPHFHGGIWWWEQDEPPDYTPPNFVVNVIIRNADRQTMASINVPGNGGTEVDYMPQFGIGLAFQVQRIG